MKSCARLFSDQHGNALIELSLILPVLVLMLLGVVDLGLVLQQEMIIADSARAGAIYALTWNTAGDTVGMQTYAANSASTVPGYSATAIVFCSCSPGGSTVGCTSSCSGATPDQYAQVTAKATIPLIFKVQGLPASFPYTAVAQVRTAWTGGH